MAAGFLYFYDAVLDRSTWEHPREAHWRRTLDDERRRVQREAEVHDMEQDIIDVVNGPQGDKMVAELRAKFLKVDIAELEAEMEVIRGQMEDVLLAVQAERGAREDEGSRRRVFMMQRQGERLKAELKGMETRMRDMVQRLHLLLKSDEADAVLTAKAGEAPVTPDAVKDMCEYLGINIYSEPHLIHIAKQALEDPLPLGWEEQRDENGHDIYVQLETGEVSSSSSFLHA